MTDILANAWLSPLAVVLSVTLLMVLAATVGLRRLAAVFARTETDLDDGVLTAVRRHVPLWCVLIGAAAALRLTTLGDRHLALGDRISIVLFILSASLVVSNIVGLFFARRNRASQIVVTSFASNIVRGVILGLGALLVLANLGISITPLLTALGVGSLAVALALQPTLSNLFAGFYLTMAQHIRVGDFVRFEGDIKGFVVDIGWRATRLREMPNNIIVIPNSRVAEMTLTNYSLPEPEQSVTIQVGVAYHSDLEMVERVTVEVAHEVLRSTPGGVANFEPLVRYHTFGDSSINFTVILRVATFADRYPVTHEFFKQLKSRYDREGIEIPFPQRVVHQAPSA